MVDLIKQGRDLINYYVACYESKYYEKPLVNRNTAKWAARDVVESFGLEECKKACDWYFKVKEAGHDWSWYAANTDKLISAYRLKQKDDVDRRVARDRAKVWLSE